ncbi:hypothetical protein GWN63_06420 [Candidatus Bathyarchaeota archaeon]|nr:hypothetical protein [Candidatus Bathyarchaeota archaeon]NIR14449.1 hypothetical protein [Desulfobacterales bacterium]NIU81853.1 hypothetical protein [Candidatus Bathyarchaeota archaeon]NIV68487.1 hypothetical protein [Candidatus Bathyarchaeota archaeon]NIW34992.1 hypothetical protein [Candidatus Bathyarchaeota archaeon]
MSETVEPEELMKLISKLTERLESTLDEVQRLADENQRLRERLEVQKPAPLSDETGKPRYII